MHYYNYSTDLPFSNKKIIFREITTNEQICLAKANLSFPNNKTNYLEYNNFVFDTVIECIKNKEDFKNINIIDYILFITKLRIVSIGSKIEFVSKNENEEIKTAKTTIDLNIFLKNLYYIAKELLDDVVISENDMKIKLNWPSISSISIFQDLFINKESDPKIILNSFPEFIEYVMIGNKKILITEFTVKQKSQIVDHISLSLFKKVQEKIIEILKKLNETNLWGVESFKNYVFNLYQLSFIDFIRLFFSYDIRSIYQEIYFMAGENLPPEYVLNLSPVERKLHSSIIVEARKKRESQESSNINRTIGKNMALGSSSVKDLALEFGQTPL